MTARLWSPTAAASAVKTTLGILIAWAIVLWFQWPDPFLAPIAVLFLQTPYLGASLRKGLMRVIGTLAGALLLLALLALLEQQRWPLLASISLVLACSVYMIRHSRYGYAWFMVAVTTAIIATDAAARPNLAFELAVYRTSEAIVGILVVLTINGILWPRTGGHAYAARYRDTVAALSAHLGTLARAIEAPDHQDAPTLPRELRRAPIELREILTAATLDSARFRRLQATYEAQIQGLTTTLGALAGLGENLRLAVDTERAFLTDDHRAHLGQILARLADAAAGIQVAPAPNAGAAAERGVAAALHAARHGQEVLLADPALDARSPRASALLHALCSQLATLSSAIAQQQETAAAIAADQPLASAARPALVRLPWSERVLDALPNAVLIALVFWVLILLWIELQWPPIGPIGVLMGVVLIGIDTIQNRPELAPAKRVALGATLGLVLAAPLYLVIMPPLDGFLALALVLFPLFFTITYFFHALPAPNNLPFSGMTLALIIMLQLEPRQTYDVLVYLHDAASLLTGFAIALTALALARPSSPQERLRRCMRGLLLSMQRAQSDLSDIRRADFSTTLAEHEQRLRQGLQRLARMRAVSVGTRRSPDDTEPQTQALTEAIETLVLRLRGLHRERAHWSGRAQRLPFATSLGRILSPAIQQTLGQFVATMDGRDQRAQTRALDAAREQARLELERLEAQRRRADGDDNLVYTLIIAGHYVAVAHALRTLANALDGIDWAAWRRPRF